MSTTLATILVGLGYDLSALEKGSPEAFRLINQQTANMSAEMKRTAREGAESWRLIDEALGIHISRPLTRLITQEFPGLAKAMGSVLGFGAAGALAVAGFEFFDKIEKGIEKAKKQQEEFVESTRKVQEVYEDALRSYEKSAKMRSLSGLHDENGNTNGLPKELFEIDFSGMDEARKHIDALTESMIHNAAAAASAAGLWSRFVAGFGDDVHEVASFKSTLGVEQINQQLSEFKNKYDELSKIDALRGTMESAELLANAIGNAKRKLDDMSARKLSTPGAMLDEIRPGWTARMGFTQSEIDAQKTYLDQLNKIDEVQSAADLDDDARKSDARKAAARETEKQDIQILQAELKGWNEANNDVWKDWIKINDEIEKAMAHLSDTALPTEGARATRIKSLLLPDKIAPPPGAPELADAAALRAVTDDQWASWQKAGQVLQEIESPMQKYTTALNSLRQLEQQGRISTEQLAQAQSVLAEQLMAAENKIEGLLKKGGAKNGADAFMMQWMGTTGKASDGLFVFDFLNKGLQGFEDETAKALTGAKTNWKSFFDELDQMAVKFLLNKGMVDLFKMLAGSSIGKSLGLGNVLGGVNPAQLAQTAAVTANTAALVANTAVLSIGAASGAAAGAGGGMAALFDAGIPAFADGTDSAPGGLAMVGEMGPELVNLPSGSGVVPNSSSRNGAMHIPITIDARGAQMGVGEQIARALEHQAPVIIARAVIEAHETQRRTTR